MPLSVVSCADATLSGAFSARSASPLAVASAETGASSKAIATAFDVGVGVGDDAGEDGVVGVGADDDADRRW